MLLLVTIVLVVLAAVTLAIGIIGDNLTLIFVSIGASAVAAIVLAVLSATNKRRGSADGAATEDIAARSEVQAQAAASIGEPVSRASGEPATQAVPVAREERTTVGLPIDDYDSLRVSDILPKLGDLDLDELEDVAQHEEANKNRATILNRIDSLMDTLEDEEAASPSGDGVAEEAAASIEEIGEPVVAVSAGGADDDFPIDGYDEMDADELIPLLDDLNADELEAVADREEAGANRDDVLDAIDDCLDILEGIVPAPTKKTAAKKTAAKKTAAKRAPAKRAPAKRTAAAKTAAKRAPAKRAPAKRAPAKRAPANRTAAAKKSTTKRAPAKKAAAAKKSTAKRAPAKKATKRA